MRKFTNPLDNIHIASPCGANWDEMFGDDRKRFCSECKLNVYNLSDMSRQEAENLLINSEGRLCVRFFRRSDGTVLTKNCPVGWQAVKTRVSRIATAALSMAAGLFGGVFALSFLQYRQGPAMGEQVIEPAVDSKMVDEVDGLYKIGQVGPENKFEKWPASRIKILRKAPKIKKARTGGSFELGGLHTTVILPKAFKR